MIQSSYGRPNFRRRSWDIPRGDVHSQERKSCPEECKANLYYAVIIVN